MKKILLTISIALLSIACFGQQLETRKVYLNEKALDNNNMRSTFFFKSITNTGKVALPPIEEEIKKHFTEGYEKSETTPWLKQSLYTPVTETENPGVIITCEYVYNKTITENEDTKQEKSGNPALPYFFQTTSYMAEISMIFNYEYQDGSSIKDTIIIAKDRTIKLGEMAINFDKLEESVIGSAKGDIHQLTAYAKNDKTWFKFPKVKVKDKALKAELATVNDLFKEGKYSEAGALYKKAFEQTKSPEASFAVGMCYELVGNYPQAAEYYKAKPDFQTKSRLKKSMKLLDYARSVGYEPTFIEF